MLLVQFKNAAGARRVGILNGDTIRVIEGYDTTYAGTGRRRSPAAGLADWPKPRQRRAESFDAIAAAGRLLPPLDHRTTPTATSPAPA
jgi:hypothetical protein